MIIDITLEEYEKLLEVLHKSYVTLAKRAGQQARRNLVISQQTKLNSKFSLSLEKKIGKQGRKQIKTMKKKEILL